jgi:hypothetical protein
VRRDIQALYTEYQTTIDPIRRQQLLSAIYAGYLEEARDDDVIWLLLCDVLALTVSFCRTPDAAKWLLLETAHNGEFPHYRWRQSKNKSLRGADPQHRGIDPRFWGKSAGSVHYPVDWENSTVAYVRLEGSPYSLEGVILEQLGDFLPAEPYFQINLVCWPLRDVLKMLHQAGLLLDASAFKPPSNSATSAAAEPGFGSKIRRSDWIEAYLTEEKGKELVRKYNRVGKAAEAVNRAMEADPKVDAFKDPRSIEPFLITAKLYPPRRSSK